MQGVKVRDGLPFVGNSFASFLTKSRCASVARQICRGPRVFGWSTGWLT